MYIKAQRFTKNTMKSNNLFIVQYYWVRLCQFCVVDFMQHQINKFNVFYQCLRCIFLFLLMLTA